MGQKIKGDGIQNSETNTNSFLKLINEHLAFQRLNDYLETIYYENKQ